MPMPNRIEVAGVEMLFHSAMVRMNRPLPDAVDGEIDPKTVSWRSHHRCHTSTNRPTHATAAAHGIRRWRQRSHRNATPSPQDEADRRSESVARQASSPAATNAFGTP